MIDNNSNNIKTSCSSWSHLKECIKNAPKWIVNLDEDDLNSFAGADEENIQVIESFTDDVGENRFLYLCESLTTRLSSECINNVCKILIFIQFPLSSPILISEMCYIQNMIDSLIPKDLDCDVKWGLSPREDRICKITCAFRYD